MPNAGAGVTTLIRNANIITVDPGRPRAQALAIQAGRFVAVGDDRTVSAGSGVQVLDLGGLTVVPGFIDAHVHVLSSGVRHVVCVDCDRASVAEIQDALRERASRTAAGQWVLGFKFDDTKTRERRFLTRTDLDAASTNHPVMVSHRAGHVHYLNSPALRLAGFGRETADPPGGRLGRDPATGDLSGVVYERAIDHVRDRLLPPTTSEIRHQGLRLICGMLAGAGVTSAHDARVSGDELITYQEARRSGELTVRIYALMHQRHFSDLRNAGLQTGFGDDRLRLGGIKLTADGAIGARTAHLTEPYVGSETDRGIQAMEPGEMMEWASQIHRAGFQVCTHANGDAAIDMVLTAYEKVQAADPRPDPRHRIEHCTVVTPGLLARMRALGCIATPFCTYVYYHGEKLSFYGEARAQWMFAQRSFLDHGVTATGASDYPPGPYEPLLGIQSCVTRTDSSGRVWGANQRISVEEALKIYTLHGARASFEEDRKGSIEAGKLADLVILGADPTRVAPATLKDIAVLGTMVAGTLVHEKPELWDTIVATS